MPSSRQRPTLDRGFAIGLGVLLLAAWLLDRVPTMPEAPPPSYGGAADLARADADGRTVRFRDFRGEPVLVVYAADWSEDSPAQLAAVRSAAPPGLRVVHVLTSTIDGYGHPATVDTARAWARRHGLAARDVIAADLTAKPLPALALFDADGTMRFEHSGLMEAATLRERLAAADIAPGGGP
ncbi:MAG: TlpA family protein disulfide reductase [Lysobacteraceae bacterium]|jgi:hypothetical protein|nr:peroxiredoxin family protein [Xanthomonadaceae bacterium]MCZ8317988.1 hypothetical protein [Silanimonas sp.]